MIRILKLKGDYMLVYEVLNNVGLRVLFVADEVIAKELCLSSGMDLSYRPVYVAEDFGSAKLELRRRRG